MSLMTEQLDAGDHVHVIGDALSVYVIAAKRMTPDSPSGISFRLLPSGSSEWIDSDEVCHIDGFSDRERGDDE